MKHKDQVERENLTAVIEFIRSIPVSSGETNIMVRPINEGRKMVGTIHLPQSSIRPTYEGHVVSVGALANTTTKVGDYVCWQMGMEVLLHIDDKFKVVCISPSTVLITQPYASMDIAEEIKKELDEINKITPSTFSQPRG